MVAAATNPRAANAVLLMFVGVGLADWLLSEASFDAGLRPAPVGPASIH
jgi:hypothetical protein